MIVEPLVYPNPADQERIGVSDVNRKHEEAEGCASDAVRLSALHPHSIEEAAVVVYLCPLHAESSDSFDVFEGLLSKALAQRVGLLANCVTILHRPREHFNSEQEHWYYHKHG